MSLITLEQYFRGKKHTQEQSKNAMLLLSRVNAFLKFKVFQGKYSYQIDPDTGTTISGTKGGTGGGGFRLPDEAGATHSSHKLAKAIDIADAGNVLDASITDDELEQFGLYREHPSATDAWVHLTTKAPGSGHRTFYP